MHFQMPSAIGFSLNRSKFLSSGKVLKGHALWEVGLHSFPKSINSGQLVPTAQADLSRNCLLLVHYLSLDGIHKYLIYLVWEFWVQNRTTFLSDNRFFEIKLK